MAIDKVQDGSYQSEIADYLRLQDLLGLCLARWRWFVLSLVVCLGVASAYLLLTPAEFTRTTSLLVKDDGKKGGMSLSAETSGLSDLGIFNNSANVQNELVALQSPDLLQDVVQRLHLDVDYTTDGVFHRELLYGSTLPVRVSFLDLRPDETSSFSLNYVNDSTFTIGNFTLNGKEMACDTIYRVRSGKNVATPVGHLLISQTAFLGGFSPDVTVLVKRKSLSSVVEDCQRHLKAVLNEQGASIIDISYSDVSVQRAEDFLNILVKVYNENWIDDKNQTSISSLKFINERLQGLEGELGNVDTDISNYKSAHLIPNIESASQMNMTTMNQANVRINDLNNQLSMAQYIRDQIRSNDNPDQLLPANSGLSSPTIEQLINVYNDKMLERNSLLANSSASNPLVADHDKNLSLMRKAILYSLDNEVSSLNTQIRGLRDIQGTSTSHLSSNPKQAKYLLSVERQQKVKESLYLYLLQKREEVGMSQAFTAYNTRVVTSPSGKTTPTSPRRFLVLLAALLLGLLIPVVIIYVRENMNTKVRGRKDLEQLTVPFAGEIPLYQNKAKDGKGEIAVHPQSRNLINEAFRVARTNLEFMAGDDTKSLVMMVTSANPGSGKTFFSANIAAAFAIKEKRVVVVDLDMRRASLSAVVGSPDRGLSDYLNGRVADWHEVLTSVDGIESMDVIPVGTMPPNPAELLFKERLEQLITELREAYDLVLLDCPPTELVADTSIIAKYAKMTVFIVRAGLMEREMLPLVESYYHDKKFNGLSVILNGTSALSGRYGYHRYGYNYGYGNYGGYTKE